MYATTDDEEVDQMLGLMTSDLEVLPLGTYVKLEVTMENRSAADEIRRKRAEGDEVRKQREEERYRRIQNLRVQRGERDQEVMTMQQRLNAKNVREMKRQEQERIDARNQERARFLAEANARTKIARALDEKLDAAELAQDRLEQQQGNRAREEHLMALEEVRQASKERKAHLAKKSRDSHEGARDALNQANELKRAQAEATRLEAEELVLARQRNEEQMAQELKERRDKTLAAKNRAKEERAERERQLKASAKLERENDAVFRRTRELQLNANRAAREAGYNSRYVDVAGAGRAGELLRDAESFRRLYGLGDGCQEEISRANEELRERLQNVKARTDDDVTDDAAGFARATVAAESKQRKAAEAARIRRENEAQLERLRNVKAVVDDDVMDEDAGAARADMAAASKAKKAAASAELKRQNTANAARIKNTVAKTDDDIDDDEAGFARAEMAAASKAKKDAEAAKLKRENTAMQDRIKNTKAAVDDDITDEAAGAARDDATGRETGLFGKSRPAGSLFGGMFGGKS